MRFPARAPTRLEQGATSVILAAASHSASATGPPLKDAAVERWAPAAGEGDPRAGARERGGTRGGARCGAQRAATDAGRGRRGRRSGARAGGGAMEEARGARAACVRGSTRAGRLQGL
jgi:hypothetical protein